MGLRYPEDLVEMGIDQELGVPVVLNNLSAEYQQATRELEVGILDILEGFEQEFVQQGSTNFLPGLPMVPGRYRRWSPVR